MSPLDSESDETLARLTADGSLGAFDQLARRYQVPLLRFIARRFPNGADAEDVLQETFVRAFAAIDSFDPSRSFRPWLFAIAFRQGVTAVRRSNVRRAEPLADGDGLPGRDLAPSMPAEEERDGLWSIARQLLTAEQVSGLWLVHVEAMPIADVAIALGKTPGSVKVMVHRARERVREEWTKRQTQNGEVHANR